MHESLHSKPQKKGAYFKQAEDSLNGLSYRGFCRAWVNAVKLTGAKAWSSSGAPRKSSHDAS
jgi:hypothetical protein